MISIDTKGDSALRIRMAVNEARRAGLMPFCITIDRKINDYLPYLFGANNFTVVNKDRAAAQQAHHAVRSVDGGFSTPSSRY